MSKNFSESRTVWLLVGLATGVCLSYFWPHEPALAAATDRSARFALATTPASALGTTEGVFTLDFLTGRLEGRVLNVAYGKFTHSYFRDVANDLGVDKDPQYAIVAGHAALPSIDGTTMAQGVVYVAEMKTGKVACYGFPYNETNQVLPPARMLPLDAFQFREGNSP